MKKKYQVRYLLFEDDIFATDIVWLKKFIALYKKDINLPFTCFGHTQSLTGEMVKLLKKGHEFIVASRMIKRAYNEEDDQILKPRKWFNQGLAIIANIIWGRNGNKCTDTTQGYRAFTRNAWKKLKINIPNPVAPDYEQIIRALKYNVKIADFPTKEGKRIHGETTMPSFKTGRENLKVLWNELIS